MRWVAIAALIAVVGVGGWLVFAGTPKPADDAASDEHDDDESESTAGLAGQGRDAAPPLEPAAPLIAALDTDDAAQVDDAVAKLRERIKAGELTLEEMLELALRADDPGRVRQLAQKKLLEKGYEARALLPRLFALIEADPTQEHDFVCSMLRRISGKSASGFLSIREEELPDDAKETFSPFLARVKALVANVDAELDVRLALLPIVEVLGPAAVDLAPALIEWIQEVEKGRERFREANPMISVSWHHYEFEIQDALSKLGPGALPPILAALREEENYGSYELESAIAEMGPEALGTLRELLNDDDGGVRLSALTAIARIEKGKPETLALLRELLDHPSASMRAGAVGLLNAYGPDVAGDILRALSDPHVKVRQVAAKGLSDFPEAAAEALPQLLKMARSKDWSEKWSTIDALTVLGPAAAEATPIVLAELADELDSEWRSYGESRNLKALVAFGDRAVAHLVEVASDKDAKLQRAAVHALENMDVDPRALSSLSSALGDLEGIAAVRAAGLLVAHDNPQALGILIEALRNESTEVRIEAAKGIARAGAAAAPTFPTLVEGLRKHKALLYAEGANWSKEWTGFAAYVDAVKAVGAFVPDRCVYLLSDENDEVQEAVAHAVVAAGERGRGVLDASWSTVAVSGRVQVVGPASARAFAKEPDPVWRPWALERFDDPEPLVRLAVSKQTRGDAEVAQKIIETWIELLAHPENDVAQNAAWELRRHASSLKPYEKQIRAAQPKEESTARRWVQEALDAIEDAD